MAITRAKKAELLEEYKAHIQKSSAIVFTNYRGLSVPRIGALRAKLRDAGVSYVVVKNSLLGLALEQAGLPQPETLLAGPNAVAFIGEDIGRGVTALMDWIKAEKVVEINGALLGNSVLDASGAEALANLPTREQMLATVLGAINAPAGSLARILNAPAASLVRVLNAYVEKQQGGAEAA
ncbi:MAG TPA: 50S ribosomal protein L10 [Caldilineaceae bacterium]|nr:50S ribosomal protein L10 [Caldilineaceae bacterium]